MLLREQPAVLPEQSEVASAAAARHEQPAQPPAAPEQQRACEGAAARQHAGAAIAACEAKCKPQKQQQQPKQKQPWRPSRSLGAASLLAGALPLLLAVLASYFSVCLELSFASRRPLPSLGQALRHLVKQEGGTEASGGGELVEDEFRACGEEGFSEELEAAHGLVAGLSEDDQFFSDQFGEFPGVTFSGEEEVSCYS
jgi:hypothetical protein